MVRVSGRRDIAVRSSLRGTERQGVRRDHEQVRRRRDVAVRKRRRRRARRSAPAAHITGRNVDVVGRDAAAAGVTGIPTFDIGTERVVGAQPYDVLAEAAVRQGGRAR